MELKPLLVVPENAEKFAAWLRTRGGLAIWQSVDISRAAQTLTTPATTEEGQPFPKPTWWVAAEPACIITDPADVIVCKDVEVKRFHVGVRMGDQGLLIKCTDGATRRIRREVDKAGEGAYYAFDYATQDAVIMKLESKLPLLDYLAQQGNPQPAL
jgi:hypothetical protein